MNSMSPLGEDLHPGVESVPRAKSPDDGMAERAVSRAAARYADAEHELRRTRFEQALRRAAAHI